MKKMILFALLFGVLRANGQVVEFGLRDNNFAKISYITSYNLCLGIEQSLLNVKLREQSGRLFFGYIHKEQLWNTIVSLYGGTEYNGNWQVYGALLKGSFTYKRLILTGSINPNYDTGMDFQLNYDIEAGLKLWERNNNYCQSITVVTSYGNIPEFRDNNRYIRVGMKFLTGNLWILPEISIPKIKESENYIRVLCSFGCMFIL